VVGGETGAKDARYMQPDWARKLRDQCLDAGPRSFSSRCGSDSKSLPICWCGHVRRFDHGDPFSDTLLSRTIECGTYAASGGKMQAWRFLVIHDRKAKEADRWGNPWTTA